VTGAGLLVALSDRGFFDTRARVGAVTRPAQPLRSLRSNSFKEAGALAKYMPGSRSSDSKLVSELATERPTGFAMGSSPDEVESGTLDALRSAVATLQQKAPGDVEAYRVFVLEIAETVGKAAGGGDQAEAATVEKIRSAPG
jgi:hypothetical protein